MIQIYSVDNKQVHKMEDLLFLCLRALLGWIHNSFHQFSEVQQ